LEADAVGEVFEAVVPGEAGWPPLSLLWRLWVIVKALLLEAPGKISSSKQGISK
jgi:hypothetical protein